MTEVHEAARWLITRGDFWNACAAAKVAIPGEFDDLTDALNLKTCDDCHTIEGVRMIHDGGQGITAPSYSCEKCFSGTDTGPCFDDLSEVNK